MFLGIPGDLAGGVGGVWGGLWGCLRGLGVMVWLGGPWVGDLGVPWGRGWGFFWRIWGGPWGGWGSSGVLGGSRGGTDCPWGFPGGVRRGGGLGRGGEILGDPWGFWGGSLGAKTASSVVCVSPPRLFLPSWCCRGPPRSWKRSWGGRWGGLPAPYASPCPAPTSACAPPSWPSASTTGLGGGGVDVLGGPGGVQGVGGAVGGPGPLGRPITAANLRFLFKKRINNDLLLWEPTSPAPSEDPTPTGGHTPSKGHTPASHAPDTGSAPPSSDTFKPCKSAFGTGEPQNLGIPRGWGSPLHPKTRVGRPPPPSPAA